MFVKRLTATPEKRFIPRPVFSGKTEDKANPVYGKRLPDEVYHIKATWQYSALFLQEKRRQMRTVRAY
jgi:hypothetical protein